MRKNKFFIVCFCVLFSIVDALSMSLSDFELGLQTKKCGKELSQYVCECVGVKKDADFTPLNMHMAERGHFGYKKLFSRKSISRNWSSFFIKSNHAFFSETDEIEFIKNVCNSEKLEYTPNESAHNNGLVFLNGDISDIKDTVGISFGASTASRDSLTEKDGELYRQECDLAIRIARLGGKEPTEEDGFASKELPLAIKVYAAKPYIASTYSLRIEVKDEVIKFNTLYPL